MSKGGAIRNIFERARELQTPAEPAPSTPIDRTQDETPVGGNPKNEESQVPHS